MYKLAKIQHLTKIGFKYSNFKCSIDSGIARGKLPPPRNPGKFAKDGEQPRPQPAIRIDSSRKLQFSFNFSKLIYFL